MLFVTVKSHFLLSLLGKLERQKISDEAEAERARKELLELQANSAAVESTGQAKAEAQSRAEAARIEGEAAVEQADLKAQAMKIEAQSELERLTQAREAEMKYIREQNELEISKAREMSDIETGKFNNMVTAIGADTIRAIATSGPEMQVRDENNFFCSKSYALRKYYLPAYVDRQRAFTIYFVYVMRCRMLFKLTLIL